MQIDKNVVIQIPVQAIHHDPEIFQDPEIFNPDRHLPGNISYQSTDLMPFGAGPRKCIGMRFAMEEAKIGLAYLFKSFKFELLEKNQQLDVDKGGIFFTALKSLKLNVEKR